MGVGNYGRDFVQTTFLYEIPLFVSFFSLFSVLELYLLVVARLEEWKLELFNVKEEIIYNFFSCRL